MAIMRYLRIGDNRYEIADEKIKVSEISPGITYYPIIGNGATDTSASRQWDSTGFQYEGFGGEEEGEVGNATLSLGNDISVGEVNSKRGNLVLYGQESSYSILQSGATGEGTGYYILLPDKQGTVALTTDIPSRTSQLTNDSGFLTSYTETDPTVPAWAKERTKPTYTAAEIGAISSVTVSRALVEGTKSATITVDGTQYDIYSRSGTITGIETTAGAHTTIDVLSGVVSFNVPTTAAHVGIKFGYTTSGNNRAVLQDSSGNLYVVQKDDNSNTTYTLSGALSSHKFTSTLTAGGSGSGTSTSEFTFAAGTGITLTDDTTNKKITIAASNNGTVTSVAATGSGGITIGGSPITSAGTLTIGLNLSTAINGLSEGASPAQLNDYAVVQYAGGGTTTTTYHRRKLSNLIVGKAVADQNGYDIDTNYISLGKNTIALANDTDLNTVITPGNYRAVSSTVAKSLTNCPIDTWFIMRVGYADGITNNWEYQEIIQGNNGARYYRQHGGGTWTAWRSYLSTSNYLKLTGGQVTGPVTFGDSVSIDDLNAGQLVVSGSASVTNNLQVNTINGVAVGSSPKFTDNNTTYSAGTGLSLSSTTFSVKLGYTTSGNNRAVQADSSGNLYVVQKDDNTTYSSKAAASGGTDVSLVTTGEKYTWNNKTSNTGTVTSITLTQGDGISIGSSGTAITTSGTRTISLATSGATAGSYGPSANASPAHGGTFSVPYVTVDTYGRVTAISTKTITLPTDSNTDTKVKFTANAPASEITAYPLFYTSTASTAEVYTNSYTRFWIKEGTASADGYSYLGLGNATASGTAANSKGYIRLYGSTAYYNQIYGGAPGANYTQTLPTNGSGTLLNTVGNQQINNITTLYREGTTANNYPAGLKFKVKDTTTGQTYDSGYLYAYQDHGSTTYGVNFVLNGGGGLFIGSGESPGSHYSAKGATYSGEDTFITADGTVFIQGNGNTIANRLGFYVNASQQVIPCKADAATNNVGSLGTSDYKWANLYVTNINGVAVGTSPKFTDNNTTYSAGTGLSLSSTTFSVKLGYTTSGNNRAVQADSSGNLYVVQKDDNTNNAVTQTATTTSASYEVLFSATADNTTRTEGARKTSTLTYNPSTKVLNNGGPYEAGGYKLFTTGTATADNVSISASDVKAQTITITAKTGYTPIGIIGWYIDTASSSGANFTRVFIYRAQITSTTQITVHMRNTAGSAAKVKVTCNVLYISSTQGT